MSDLYLYLARFGDGDGNAPSPHDREQARIRPRYTDLVARTTGLDAVTVERVMAALFDHPRADGSACACGCHPHFSATHDDGFDCPCTWDDERRTAQRRRRTAWWDSPAGAEARAHQDAERAALAAWVAAQPGVTATRTSSAGPEQWEGTVDGRSFYFRERHGAWSLEVDLEPDGHFVERVVGVDDAGRPVTEPHELSSGRVVARGLDDALGETAIAHLDFIVRTIRDQLWAESCTHQGALFYCPVCGNRM